MRSTAKAKRRWLPRSGTLPVADWERRHRGLLWLLWGHAPALALLAFSRGASLEHAAGEGAVIAAFAIVGIGGAHHRRLRSIAVSLGLITCSAMLIHIWDGHIEAHFHFFVVISILSLYEDWLPFGLAFGYVVAHHGVLGVLSPESVYNHPAAVAHPWTWALIHGVFVSGAGMAGVVAWRCNEHTRAFIDHQSVHDPLTGLPNRILFRDRLDLALARARREGGVDAVMFLDLDEFKVINDSLGHPAGDEVLLEVARRLDGLLRAEDTVARFGGDEFTVLVEGLPTESAALEVAYRVRDCLTEPLFLAGREIALSASVGLVLTGGSDSSDDLLRDADAAMYRAKEKGRSGVELFDADLREKVTARLELESDLRVAIGRGELRTHYQPKVRIETGEVVGVEALIRWQHPVHGLIPPGRFIPLAEETGLIVDIGEWVLRDACRQAARWVQQLDPSQEFVVAVNLSHRQLEDSRILSVVSAVLDETGLDPRRLCLEITETAVMRDLETSVQLLSAFKALGVRLAIDDFGVGFSSLSQLKHLPPIDLLKIDKSFVDGLTVGGDDRAIVAAILSLARALGITGIAEGVEHLEQVEALDALGCELAQGFHYFRPQAPDTLEPQLLEGYAAITAGAES